MNILPRERHIAARRSALAAGLLLISVCATCRPASDAEPEPETAPNPSVEVSAVRARSRALRPRIELAGRLGALPERSARVSSRVAGTIVTVEVSEGQHVDKGQVVARLDNTLFAAATERARALAAGQSAILERLVKGPRPQEIAAAAATLQGAQAVSRGAAVRLEALELLNAGTEISSVRLADARVARDTADAGVAAARAAADLLSAGTRPETVAEARASLATARSDLATAEAREQFAVLKAPIAGIVTVLTARVGLSVGAANVVMEIVDLDNLLLRVRLPASVVPLAPVGTRCLLDFDALPDNALQGRIDRLGALGDLATGGVWAYVAVANDDALLRPNMTGHATLLPAPLAPSIVVPVACAADRSGTSVVTVIRDGAAHEVEVRTGVRAEGWVQILEGVDEGDWIATEGGYGLPEGQAVTVIEDTPAGEQP